jgi:hypothetical protein
MGHIGSALRCGHSFYTIKNLNNQLQTRPVAGSPGGKKSGFVTKKECRSYSIIVSPSCRCHAAPCFPFFAWGSFAVLAFGRFCLADICVLSSGA